MYIYRTNLISTLNICFQYAFRDIKQETLSGDEPTSPVGLLPPATSCVASASDQEATNPLLLSQFSKLYESPELGNSLLTKYTQLLSTFHQQQQQQLQTSMALGSAAPSQTVTSASLQQSSPANNNQDVERETESPGISSLIPTTVNEQHQISPTPKDAKVRLLIPST